MSKSIFLYLAAVTLFTVVLFRPFTLHLRDAVVNVIDPLFYAWNLQYNADVMEGKEKSAFDTNIFYPLTNTIAYSDTLWAQSLLATPIIWATGNAILAQNILIILSFVVSAGSMYLLLYYLTKHQAASFISALFFAFSYPRIAQIGHLPFLSSQWVPLVILYTLKFFDEGKTRSLLAAYIFYALATASSIYFGVFLTPMLCIVTLVQVCIWVSRNKQHILWNRLKTVGYLFIPFVLGFVLINLPYLRLMAEHPEYKRTLFDTYNLRALPIDYISVLPQSLLLTIGFPSAPPEHALYPTLILFFTSIIGTYKAWVGNKKLVLICVISGLTYLILSFGVEQTIFGRTIKMPYYYLFNAIPIFRAVRVPARFGLFVIFNLTILSSFALQQVFNRKYSLLKIFTVITLFLIEIWQIQTPFVRIPLRNTLPAVYTWLTNQPIQIVVAELPLRLFYTGRSMEGQLMKQYADLDEMDNYALETYRIYFSAFHKKRMINGYSGFFPESYNRLAETLEGFPSEFSIKALQDIGVTYAVVHIRQYENEKRGEITRVLAHSPLLTLSYSRGDDLVYTISKKK